MLGTAFQWMNLCRYSSKQHRGHFRECLNLRSGIKLKQKEIACEAGVIWASWESGQVLEYFGHRESSLALALGFPSPATCSDEILSPSDLPKKSIA